MLLLMNVGLAPSEATLDQGLKLEPMSPSCGSSSISELNVNSPSVPSSLLASKHTTQPLGKTIVPKTLAALPKPASYITMSSIISSLQTIVFWSGTILASTVFLWCLWHTCGYAGFPIGRMINPLADLEAENNENTQSAKFAGGMIGGLLCYCHIAWKAVYLLGTQHPGLPSGGFYDITFWIVKFVLQTCGEAVAILAILSGVVVVLGLNGRKQVRVPLEKKKGHKA
jgi:hypothetical protein